MVTCTFYILNLAGFLYETKTTLVAEIVVFNFFQLNKKFYSKSQISHKTNTEVISFLELVSNPLFWKMQWNTFTQNQPKETLYLEFQ